MKKKRRLDKIKEPPHMSKKNLHLNCSRCSSYKKSIFCSLEAGVLQKLNIIKHLKEVKKGSSLPLVSERGAKFYCICTGHALVKLRSPILDQVIEIVGPGEFLGMESYLPENEFTAVALSDCSLCEFNLESFLKFQGQNPQISESFFRFLTRRLGLANEKIAHLKNQSVRERVCSSLLDLVEKYGVQKPIGEEISLDLSRDTLAQLAGTVTETLSRILKELVLEGILLKKGRRLIVLKKECL